MELNGASIQSHAMLPNCARSLGGLAESRLLDRVLRIDLSS
jgi:hypothetical protein